MKKTIIFLFAITSFFISFNAFSGGLYRDLNYVCYDFGMGNDLKSTLKNNTKVYLKDGQFLTNIKYTFSLYKYQKANSYILTTNADVIVIFAKLDPTDFDKYDVQGQNYDPNYFQKTQAYYIKMISDIRNANPNSIICGILISKPYNGFDPSDNYEHAFVDAFMNAFKSFPADKQLSITSLTIDAQGHFNNSFVAHLMTFLALEYVYLPKPHKPIVPNMTNGHTIQSDSNLQSINP
ncbi:hypothetical protein P0136_11920 [Lentisphaerota bacterium ZTH]|nr:hypothetical protein JYG24_10565 [Lentisphaerota bacterium]WET06064.1 hypothetical protein P0136_11920 [Lentisphaerota bacterium ZTH]